MDDPKRYFKGRQNILFTFVALNNFNTVFNGGKINEPSGGLFQMVQ